MRRMFALSKWLHKYVGLLLLLFLTWMSVSGVLMNHPGLIAGLSVPSWLIPAQYRPEGWNRHMLSDLVFSPGDPDVAFAGGKPGVWITRDGGRTFARFDEGLPGALFLRRTRDLLLVESGGREALLAATDGGLYLRDLGAPGDPAGRSSRWERVDLGTGRQAVRKVVQVGDRLVAGAESGFFVSPVPPAPTSFAAVAVPRDEPEPRVTLVQLFFDVHYGKAWGLPGLLVFDAVGLSLLFLCVSAFYTWYFPWQSRRNRRSRLLGNPATRRLFKTLFRYHLKLGIWIAAFLLVVGGTGLFMRPPLLAAIAGGSIPRSAYPGFLPDDPWHGKIQNLMHDPVEGALIVQASDGLWIGRAALDQPFRRHALDVPIFVMGATVLELDGDGEGDGGYVVGSFGGLFRQGRDGAGAVDLFTGRPPAVESTLRPGEPMVAGYFETPAGERFVVDFERGVLPLPGAALDGRFAQPPELTAGYRMPLWSYLFEIHNGRFFKDLIGELYLLVVPLGSLLFLMIVLSGIYDWVWLRLPRRGSDAQPGAGA